jgi:hypothetical protein
MRSTPRIDLKDSGGMTPSQMTDAIMKAVFHDLVLPLLVILLAFLALLFLAALLIRLSRRTLRAAFRPRSSTHSRWNTDALAVPPQDRWRCARCGSFVSSRVRDYCLARPNRFHGQVFCIWHQRSPRMKFWGHYHEH